VLRLGLGIESIQYVLGTSKPVQRPTIKKSKNMKEDDFRSVGLLDEEDDIREDVKKVFKNKIGETRCISFIS